MISAQVPRNDEFLREAAAADPRIELALSDDPEPVHRARFAACDVCLSPTRWEGLGLPLFEATGFGLPIITNDKPPMSEMVLDGRSGILVGSIANGEARSGITAWDPDPAELTAAIERLGDRAELERMREGVAELRSSAPGGTPSPVSRSCWDRAMTESVRELEGKVGLPMPLAELAAREWDAVVVGGGHNGLVAAAYLARAGRSVLVLERRDQLGGACTIERPFADERYLVSPCAYVVGLLDELVVAELELRRHGYEVTPCDPHLWCGFADGSSYADFADGAATAAYLRGQGFSEADIAGLDSYYGLIGRARAALRHGERDSWVGSSPSRSELERMLGGDEELIGLVFEDSVADVLRRHVSDPRLHQALWGQGVIGTDAGPETPGTGAVKLMHSQGTLNGAAGMGGAWGFVTGGMGTVSFAIADSAREAGAVLAAGVPVASIHPGEGVELEGGERIRARSGDLQRRPEATASDAARRLDAGRLRRAARRLADELAGREAERGAAAHADVQRRARGLPAGAGDGHRRAAAGGGPGRLGRGSKAGEVRIAFCELYFHTAYDPSVAPAGRQTMSVFCAVRAARQRRRAQGRRGDPRPDRDRGARHPRLHRVRRGARPGRHRGADRADRRAHLPGLGAARSDVGAPLRPPHAARGPVHVWRRDAPGRLGDRPQRPQRRTAAIADLEGGRRGRPGAAHGVSVGPASSASEAETRPDASARC